MRLKVVYDAKKLLKHQKAKISSADSINSGDHISYKTSRMHDHHVIVENVNRDGDKTELTVFSVTGTKDKAVVCNEVVDIQQFLVKGKVFRHTYNEAVGLMYNAVNIIERARYLWTEFQTTLPKLEPPIENCEDFATWCQIGMTFPQMFQAHLGKLKNSITTVQTVNDLNKGDHVSFKSCSNRYRHAIVIEIDSMSLKSLRLVYLKHDNTIKSICQEKMSATKLIKKGKLRRHNYNLSIHPRGEITAQRAISCTNETIKELRSCEEFATWCYLDKELSYQKAEYLGMARMLGRLRIKIKSIAELSKGDHVAWHLSSDFKSRISFSSDFHHAIVVGVIQERQAVAVVHFASRNNTCHTIRENRKVHIVLQSVAIKEKLEEGQLFKYMYCPSASYTSNRTVKIAKRYLNNALIQHFYNCEHFATSCRSEKDNWGFGFGLTIPSTISISEDETTITMNAGVDS